MLKKNGLIVFVGNIARLFRSFLEKFQPMIKNVFIVFANIAEQTNISKEQHSFSQELIFYKGIMCKLWAIRATLQQEKTNKNKEFV